MDDSQQQSEPLWVTLGRAEIGMHELAGPASNATIAEAFALCGLDPATHDDSTTPWCACWANLMLHRAGIVGTNRANARSFMDFGVPLLRPQLGCIVVFCRPPNPASGHVGFWLAENEKGTETLAGNSANQVRISYEPTNRVIGWRWPSSS